jgi:hypothetical protein
MFDRHLRSEKHNYNDYRIPDYVGGWPHVRGEIILENIERKLMKEIARMEMDDREEKLAV